jgi:hypothetical protein
MRTAFTTDADTTPPTILDISSDVVNGSYGTGQSIPVMVTFSEAVTSTGSVTLLFETGTTDQSCTFTVTGATTGTCAYVVQAGDSSSDLTVQSVSGTITDSASNAMVFFTPLQNLADNKEIVIDTIAPVVTLLGSASVSVSQGSGYSDAGATAADNPEGDITGGIVTTGSVNTATAGTYTLTYSVSDAAGNAAIPVTRTVTVTTVTVVTDVVPTPSSGGGAISASTSIFPSSVQPAVDGLKTALTMLVNGLALPVHRVSSPRINISFNAQGKTVRGYALSLRPDFQGAGIYPYQSSIQLTLPPQSGRYTVYAKLFSSTGDPSPVLTSFVDVLPVQSSVIAVTTTKATSVQPPYQFMRNLRLGMRGEDVRELQKLLNEKGFQIAKRGNGSSGNETTYFGAATMRAVILFQEAHRQRLLDPLSLKEGTGNVLGFTRAFLNKGSF